MSANSNFSAHEPRSVDAVIKSGTDRAFGCTVGGVLMAIAVAKVLLAQAITPTPSLIFAAGAALVFFGIVAPARLALLHRWWLRLGALMAAIVNPVIMAILFFVCVAPMALIMRLVKKRPLGLAYDPAAVSYWIPRDLDEAGKSSMRQQF